ncbi:hypothetical protein PCANC_17470 [Puccinia coronata f. sp. avenae]|uniref:Uncharacterized protein n=1 Tax=Puccinia coronata f. sp. avenae TaxID=200324 RepID=A0A2N5UVL7_9BASI|nr:hypothetical protein PCANC_17470 [Puccinia coronata f. sp. avenae]PLW41812.1 hypothetical protein PCASD_05537 [Puccinia coronata f. sp. avenae]
MAIGPGAHQAAQAQSGLGRAGTRQAAIPPGGSGGKAQAAEGASLINLLEAHHGHAATHLGQQVTTRKPLLFTWRFPSSPALD